LLTVSVGPAAAAPTVAEMLRFTPDYEVPISTPTAEEYASCEVKLVTGSRPGSSGWALLDAKKQTLRRFFASGGKKIDIWSYYKDGIEVFRTIDSNGDGLPDQYRWLNGAGMKWGVSSQQDKKIDSWTMISAEEVGQEVFAALATNDFARLQALFITEAEMRALKLPAAEAQRMLALQKSAAAKFQATRAKLAQLDAKARFVRVESGTPNSVPAETNGTDQDQLRFPYRTILFESGDKEKRHDWVQTGEMIKVGMAWRLIDAPGVQDAAPPSGIEDPALQKIIDELAALDKTPPAPLSGPRVDKAVKDYNVARVALIQRILKVVRPEEQETWYKQIFDNLSAAYQAGHEDSLKQLTEWRGRVINSPNLAGYGSYRELWATYAAKLLNPTPKIQEEWLNQLAKFAQTYPQAEDTPDALWLLAMGSEYGGKDEEAKRWYQQIYQNFPTHALAAKAKGSESRLNIIGRPLELTGPQLGTGGSYNISGSKGKVVVVYYWASTVGVCERDFDTLKRVQAAHAKEMELVCVNLDNAAEAASAFLQKAQVTGIHLFQPGGLSSPFAIQYGINGLPHLFLVGVDGLVLNRTLQVGDLEGELRKALPKN
jgi:tetratricopeptide (TPR) repeat protein